MPRGQKRSEIEIIQAQIAEAEKKREKNMNAANLEKKKISQLEKQIEKTYADNIAKACRAKGIGLETVLKWVQEQPSPDEQKAAPPAAPAKPAAKRASAKKPAAKKPAAKKPAAKKPAAKKAAAVAEPTPEAPDEGEAKE